MYSIRLWNRGEDRNLSQSCGLPDFFGTFTACSVHRTTITQFGSRNIGTKYYCQILDTHTPTNIYAGLTICVRLPCNDNLSWYWLVLSGYWWDLQGESGSPSLIPCVKRRSNECKLAGHGGRPTLRELPAKWKRRRRLSLRNWAR